jgi:uncharacterized delta-60 repeat protein
MSPGRIGVSPSSQDFGAVQVGGAAVDRTFTVTNSGQGTLYGTASVTSPFSVIGSNLYNLSGGQAQLMVVRYSPPGVESDSASVTFSGAYGAVPTRLVSGAGVGTGSIISLSGNLSFGNIIVGASTNRVLTLNNLGIVPLTVSGIICPAGFSCAWSGTIASGSSVAVTVTFAPTTTNVYNGTLTVDSDATSGTSTSPITGTGVARVISLSGNLSFGNVVVGGSKIRLLTISNLGNLPLTVSGISYPSGFTGDWSGTIAGAGCTNVTVIFTPTATNVYNGYLVVNSDATSGTGSVPVAGTSLLNGNSFAGNVDSSFNPGPDGSVYGLALQPDGKVLVGGDFLTIGGAAQSFIARLNADGTADGAFAPALDSTASCIAVQADGKILIAGYFSNVNGATRNYLARLNADGTLDTGFSPELDSSVNAVAVQADGKILVGGYFTTVDGTPRNSIARLNADGTVDTTFNPNANGTVYSVLVQSDGKILVGGDFTAVGGTLRNRIARLNVDGTPDGSFNPDLNSYVLSVALQADGKVILGGDFTEVSGIVRNHLARLDTDGTVDTDFNPDSNGYVYSIAVQADGGVLIGGGFTSVGGVTRNYIARLTTDGTLEPEVELQPSDSVFGIAVQADGKILMGGSFTSIGGVNMSYLARLLNDPAPMNLTVPNTNSVEWLRSGTAPEVVQVSFELSTNSGSAWTQLGDALRINGGWQLTGITLPQGGQIRARGRVVGGMCNGSSGRIELVAAYAVPDTTPPLLTCPPDVVVFSDAGQCYATGVALGTPIASDDSGTVMVSSNAPALFPLGTNSVTWTATDPSGNTNFCTQLVIVQEATPPTVMCPANMAVLAADINGAVVNYTVATNGGCPPLSLVCVPPSGSTFAIGTNTVTVTVTDACGLSNSGSFTIMVTTLPVVLNVGHPDGQPVLTWPVGVLQASDRVDGTYTNVPNAISPFTITPTGSEQYYYRVKVQ